MRTKKCKNKKCDQFLTEKPQYCKKCTASSDRRRYKICSCKKDALSYKIGYCSSCTEKPERKKCTVSSCLTHTKDIYCSYHKPKIKLIRQNLKKRFKFIKPKHSRCYFCTNLPRNREKRYLNKYYLCEYHKIPKYLNKLRRKDFKETCLKKERSSRKIRFSKNIKSKLIQNLRSRLYTFTKENVIKKTKRFNDYIGCTGEQLKNYLEERFQPGMNWENYGVNGWHIDHIIPLNSFKTEEELYKLCHYSNLQPLWSEDNILKSDKITHQKTI